MRELSRSSVTAAGIASSATLGLALLVFACGCRTARVPAAQGPPTLLREGDQARTLYPVYTRYYDLWSNPWADRYATFLSDRPISPNDQKGLDSLVRSTQPHHTFLNAGSADLVALTQIATRDQSRDQTRWVIGTRPLVIGLGNAASPPAGSLAAHESPPAATVRLITPADTDATVTRVIVLDRWPRFPTRAVETFLDHAPLPEGRRVIDLPAPTALGTLLTHPAPPAER